MGSGSVGSGAGVVGTTWTDSSATATNRSTGQASGMAASTGSSHANVAGSAGIQGIGGADGRSNAKLGTTIVAGPNQGASTTGRMDSGFEAHVSYTRSAIAGGTSQQVDARTGGFANGSTSTNTSLTGLNAAGVARIGADAGYFSQSNLRAGRP
jgi:hypothetical protein